MKESGVRENPSILARFDSLRTVGQSLFISESMQGGITKDHIQQAREFLSKGARETNPTVMASYWGHVIIAAELGKRVAQSLNRQAGIVNPLETEFLLWLHDLGRLVIPGAYLRNDFFGNRLLADVGIPLSVRKKFPSVGKLLTTADGINFTENQLAFEEPLNKDQQQMANLYFSSLSPTQRIVNLADNLGKGGPLGIFNLQQFIHYLKTQEDRYPDQESPWASVHWATTDNRRKKGAVLQAYVVEQTLHWVEKMGVNFEEIRSGLVNYGPRFVVIARHGELHNPTQIVYNRDSEMAEEDIIHLD